MRRAKDEDVPTTEEAEQASARLLVGADQIPALMASLVQFVLDTLKRIGASYEVLQVFVRRLGLSDSHVEPPRTFWDSTMIAGGIKL